MNKLACILCLLSFSAWSQQEQAVMEPIHRMFEGMKKGDSALVHSAFYPDAVFHTVIANPKTKSSSLRSEAVATFLAAVGTPHNEVWNEVIWGEEIRIDGNFSQVWVQYAFYLGNTFNHCGVDAFHLISDSSGRWKIFSGTDTRQKEGCVVPKEISDRFR